MHLRRRLFCPTLSACTLVAVLAACGGGGGSSTAPAPGTPVHGTLLQNPPQRVSLLSAVGIASRLGDIPQQALALLAVAPVCDVAVYHLTYETVGGAGEPTTASAALMVPVGLDARCRGPRPVVLYAHGTSTDRNFNIADLEIQKNGEGIALAAFFASQGDIVVAPNFTGYDTSMLPYHPFLVADAQSSDMIDALTAARSALPVSSAPLTTDGGRLFITGYSQGGYVAMATHRAMQLAGMPVTAAAPMSGPYALAAFVDAIFAGRVNGGGPVSATLLITGYEHAYGNIYAATTDVFSAEYATGIESLLPSTSSRSGLYAAGKLPQYALFSSTAPSPEFVALTPATDPAALASVFAQGFGTGNLITNDYRQKYLLDAQANPDGGWPTMTTGVAAPAPGLAWRDALRRNDLRTFTPTSPVLLCGGDSDPIVYWFNTQLMQGYWSHQVPAPGAVTVLDVDAGATTSGGYANLRTGFAIAKSAVAAAAVIGGATDGGASAVLDAYHASLVAPFCFAAVQEFFAEH